MPTAKKKPAARKPSVRRPSNFDEFTQAYLEAALWSSTDDEGNPLDSKYGIDDIKTPTLASMVRDAKSFQREHGHLFRGHEDRAGHDFWLNRNGHGAGFWDGGWSERVADKLDKASQFYGEFYLGEGDFKKSSRSNGYGRSMMARRNPEVECREPRKHFDRYRGAQVMHKGEWVQVEGCWTGSRYVGRAEGAKKRTTIPKKVVRQKASRTPSHVKGARARKRK